jgi:ABC-type phosphate transport system permease subunit
MNSTDIESQGTPSQTDEMELILDLNRQVAELRDQMARLDGKADTIERWLAASNRNMLWSAAILLVIVIAMIFIFAFLISRH